MEIYFQPLKVCVARINAGLFYFMTRRIFYAEDYKTSLEIMYSVGFVHFEIFINNKKKYKFKFDIETTNEINDNILKCICKSSKLSDILKKEINNEGGKNG